MLCNKTTSGCLPFNLQFLTPLTILYTIWSIVLVVVVLVVVVVYKCYFLTTLFCCFIFGGIYCEERL